MTEFDRNELADIILLFRFYTTHGGVTRPADYLIQLEGVRGQGNEVLNKITSKCGIDLERYQEHFSFVPMFNYEKE